MISPTTIPTIIQPNPSVMAAVMNSIRDEARVRIWIVIILGVVGIILIVLKKFIKDIFR